MADPGNPFAAMPTQAAYPPQPAGGNPFDPFGSPAPAPAPNAQPSYQASPGMGMPQAASPAPYNYGPSSPGMDPMAGVSQGQQYHPEQQYVQSPAMGHPAPADYGQQQYPLMQQQQQGYSPAQQPYGQPPMPSPQQQQQQTYGAASSEGGYDPFSAALVPHPSPSHPSPSHFDQSNPFGSVAAPAYGDQSLVPVQQQPGSQWGLPQTSPAAPFTSAGSIGSGSMGFDPLAPPPARPPAPPPQAPVTDPWATNDNSLAPVAPGESFAPPISPPPAAPAPEPTYQQYPAPADVQSVHSNPYPDQSQALTTTSGGRSYASELPHSSSQTETQIVLAPKPAGVEARNKYSGAIARQAPPDASALPKADLVRKTGYVLSRISFRTIVMKKWKQSYWVQYGSHTMLWFRSQADFDDWLNNPYHTQGQRNFLIKLAVNFVHDLYKPNVRGYQVTQCRSKPYGTKMVRQFKLERWMDYGPTIAAAFGSYDPKEVDALREAIVECMRNTPLDGGIRATGAVRQAQEEQHRQESDQRHHQENRGGYDSHNSNAPSSHQQQYPSSSGHNGYGASGNRAAARSVASANDLLDDHHGFDDTASYPGVGSSAVVLAQNPSQSYPGAPPMPAQQGYPPQQQAYPAQQSYPSQEPYQQQQQYGSPQQQQYAPQQQGHGPYQQQSANQQHYQQQPMQQPF